MECNIIIINKYIFIVYDTVERERERESEERKTKYRKKYCNNKEELPHILSFMIGS
jgi:hypothetical protein